MPPRPAAPPRPSAPPDIPAQRAAPPPEGGPRGVTARASLRLATAVTCLVLGTGLLGGAAAGAWLVGDGDDHSSAAAALDERRDLWREIPVDVLFPPEITGEGAGPGGSDRLWIRVAVAPDATCAEAFDPLLADVLAPVGCHRLLRATYADETQTTVTTVGLMFTEAGPARMDALAARLTTEGLDARADLMPRPFAAPGTPAEDFGDEQRGAWTIKALPGLPVVAYAVTGFADGRPLTDPRPAAEATAEGQDTTVALAGLGHDAAGIAERVERDLRATADQRVEEH
ncbi:hypothetical protein [Streptomyces sp. PT12]|uniref:hypothetical protein n=1 Tax=Streptomyces sp. PT12 TaxID=1510197 RepID=UPI000DE54389|nr:hypothetical protein [Streptomyces sp. PT12]RBM23914.1 hypothetical protein DEH69_01125 [Streptomyces sp. PT12]